MDLGKTGEILASRFLEDRGYDILERNFRFARGEIDIISYKEGVLVFTEVKTRSSRRYGRPLDAVDVFKRRQIYKTAEYYLSSRSVGYREVRFDVIEVFIGEKSMIHYIKNAFDGNDLEE
ncbi:MAG: YraN family protein [Peptoniphilus sp.]|nr:YraN family protein [Peptoniphilus sp.]MDD7363855.1 YraN family protein [Bacillota bacterium]MDY6044306.1 YraN family protein [Peptoniphilus sp.]